MKNFKRISSLIVALVMIVATMSAMFVTSSAVAAGDKYTCDFFMTRNDKTNMKVVDEAGIWVVGGVDRETHAFTPIDMNTLKDGDWIVIYTDEAHKTSNGYVIGCPEKPATNSKFDLATYAAPRATIDPAIVFVAPADGTYTFAGEFAYPYLTCDGSISAHKISGTTYTNIGEPVVTPFETKNTAVEGVKLNCEVELKKGEMLVIVSENGSERKDGNTSAPSTRVGVVSLEVTVKSVASSGSTPSTPSNPTTGDALVVSFAVAVVAGVAIVVSKKRR